LTDKKARAFSPAGISSFFEICETTPDGKPILDLERVGARGGGFGLQKGILTEVTAIEAEKNKVSILINGISAPKAQTTKTVAKMFLEKVEKKYEITINHKVQIPIGTGFGTSAGGAVTTGLALSKILDLNLTYNQIGKMAHKAEIICKTGLGTVGPLMLGGCILTLEPGAPGISIIDRIPLSDKYTIVCGVIKSISTKSILNSEKMRQVVNLWGKKTLEQILLKPSPENFMNSSLRFAEKTGFMTPTTKKLVKIAKKAGAIGTAQNMVGEAVHTLVPTENAKNIIKAFEKVLPKEKIIISKIDFQGARLL
jgi:pantoate kinase